MPTDIYNTTSVWTCPTGVTSVLIQCWGAGANGQPGLNPIPLAGDSGGGGSFAQKTFYSVTPGSGYLASVGVRALTAGDSFFGNSSVVLAKGANGTTGGLASSSVGDILFKGGDAGSVGGADASAGGGGSATSSADGQNGFSGSGSFGGNGGLGEGAGANGANSGNIGNDGSAPGGGASGGAGSSGFAGGLGANGRVSITYTIGSPVYRSRTMASGSLIFSFLIGLCSFLSSIVFLRLKG